MTSEANVRRHSHTGGYDHSGGNLTSGSDRRGRMYQRGCRPPGFGESLIRQSPRDSRPNADHKARPLPGTCGIRTVCTAGLQLVDCSQKRLL